jgi:NADPH2:quinone reductase
MTLPATMNFIAHTQGGPDRMRIATGPVPLPAPDEVLIRVQAVGVNRPDVLQRQGSYNPPPGASPILGLEASGEVVAIGADVTTVAVGERVCALTNGGAYAEYVVAPAGQTLPFPHGYDALRAAALPETYFTVWANLFMMGRLGAGESVLVHGGSSGIGVTAIKLAREFGATVHTTAGSAAKCSSCLEFGAAQAINYREQDFADAVRAATDKRGVDVVLDMVGGPYFTRNLRSLAIDGRLVIIAFLEGSKPTDVDLMPIMTRRLTVTGSTMRPRTSAQKAAIAEELRARVWPVLAAGRCGPVIHAVFPLAEAAAAHALMESGAHIGKIMLTVAA